MNWTAKNAHGDSEEFQCECGTDLFVTIVKQAGHNENESYRCPSCKKEYTVRASMPPQVRIVNTPTSE